MSMRVASYTLIISSEDHDCVDYVTFHRKSKVVQNIFKPENVRSTDTWGSIPVPLIVMRPR